jgi:dihydroorotase
MKLLVKGGRVVDPSQGLDARADVLIAAGRVERVGPDLPVDGARVLEATGRVVTPGLIDMHVHLRDPGFEYKEDVVSGSRAAARGGFTSICAMPNTNPVVDNQVLVRYVREKADLAGYCRVLPVGALSKGARGEELAEMGDMAAAGAVAFSDDGLPVSSAELMRLALTYAAPLGRPIITHAEDRSLSEGGQMHLGYWSTILGLRGIPGAAEEVMVARDLILAELSGGHVHVAHVSTRGSVELIRAAKARAAATGSFTVTCECAPHHFTLTDQAVHASRYDTNTKVNPPLRTAADVAALKEALADGTIDVIASDHAPHHADEKNVEFNYAAFGIASLEVSLALSLTALVESGTLSLERLIEKMSTAPARVLGLQGLGSLAPGSAGDIAVIDPGATFTVDVSSWESKGKNAPYQGRRLCGRVVATVLGGKVIMEDGRLGGEGS